MVFVCGLQLLMKKQCFCILFCVIVMQQKNIVFIAFLVIFVFLWSETNFSSVIVRSRVVVVLFTPPTIVTDWRQHQFIVHYYCLFRFALCAPRKKKTVNFDLNKKKNPRLLYSKVKEKVFQSLNKKENSVLRI